MNYDERDQLSAEEIANLARGMHLPPREGFMERVFEKIREREIEQEKRLERERTPERNRDRGIER